MELLNYPAEDGSRERPALQVQISGTSMPKSKSKRNKLYRPRTIKVGPYWTPEQQANIEEKLRRVAMFVEVTLPAGTATFWQMDWIEDTLNWFLGMLYKRFKHLETQRSRAVAH